MADSDVFSALADATRRQLVDWLAEEGSGTATRFAERLPISRQAVARHLQELEKAGVVDSSRSGRENRYVLRPEPLTRAAGWLEARAGAWDRTLVRLRDHLE
ncbi:MAG: helix-turn-helix transcriptional regulator [Acidobacteria bacterium]|nr:helix-turn-helix transcriptional regulator [Acidobacteriota bacterium]